MDCFPNDERINDDEMCNIEGFHPSEGRDLVGREPMNLELGDVANRYVATSNRTKTLKINLCSDKL